MKADPDFEGLLSVLFEKKEEVSSFLSERSRDSAGVSAALKYQTRGGTSGNMDSVDAKIAAAEARTDTKFAQLEGKLDLMLQRLETINEKATDARGESRATRRTIIGTGLSLGALMLAIAAFGVNVFGLGSRVDEIARQEAQQVYIQREAARALSEPRAITASPAPKPTTTPR